MANEISGRVGSRLPLLPQELHLSDDFIGGSGPPLPDQIWLSSFLCLAKGVYCQLIPAADAYVSSIAGPVEKLTFFLWHAAFVDLPPFSFIKGDPAWLQGCLSRTERSNELGINLVACARSTWRGSPHEAEEQTMVTRTALNERQSVLYWFYTHTVKPNTKMGG
ncbi:hypothetical protein EDC04DRAFT_2597680 [Pisolithus marmoratus]|nr:hypothetical protein EDC04DRAFT_2597680 [Pisolithus marmoratus]